MNNKGNITVFMTLMLGLMLMLGVSVLKLVELRAAKAKASMCAAETLSSVKAQYNKYIFERYHILLFDKNCSGRGEAYLEEYMKSLLEENLGEGYEVTDVRGADYELLMDNNLEEFKKQIDDYIIYAGIQYGVEQLTDATGDSDGTVDDDILDEIDSAALNLAENTESEEEEDEGTEETTPWYLQSTSDPRDFVKNFFRGSIMSFVLPAGMTPSTEGHNIFESPSFEMGSIVENAFDNTEVDTDFDDTDQLIDDLTYHDSWLDSVKSAGEAAFYARTVFNCATNTGINDQTVFEYELEYIIAGRNTDYKNLEKTVNEIISIRLPVNFVYLLASTSKMARVKVVSYTAALGNPVVEKVIRYLVAGCWAYLESLCDARALLAGKRVAFVKNDANWITDIGNLGESIYSDMPTDEHGLCYEDYLMILLALNIDRTYLRMLDLIELNAQLVDEDFQIESATASLTVDFIIKYNQSDCSVSAAAGY